MDGLTPDQKALFLAQEQKAADGNRALSRVQELEARLAAVQNQQYSQQQANPMAEMVAELQQQAPYDVNARASLAALTLQAAQQAEIETLRAMTRAGVPAARQDIVAGLVRQSGYRMSVEQADQLARGAEVPDLARQLEAERQRSAALQKALDGRTVGSGAPQGSPTATTPASAGAGSAPEMTAEEYAAALSRGGPEAMALRDKGVRIIRR